VTNRSLNSTLLCARDGDRTRFLNQLSRELGALAERELESVHRVEAMLREIHDSQPIEFKGDSVMGHVEACLEELHRIGELEERPGSNE
jgi:hypothetical protein